MIKLEVTMRNYEQLERIRKSAEMKKKEMAELLGVTPRQYCVWANSDAPDKYLEIAEKRITGDPARLERLEKKLALLLKFLAVPDEN